MKKIIVLGFVFVSTLVFGQNDSPKEKFVYLFSDSLVKSHMVEFRYQYNDKSYLVTDSGRYRVDLVKFYQNESGFFANTKALNFSNASIFAKRIVSGRINLYEIVKVRTTPGSIEAYGVLSPGTTSIKIKNYYNKEFGDIRKANYHNLLNDLADCPESVGYLVRYKNIRNTQTVLSIVGGALIAGGLATLYSRTKDVNRNDPNYKEPNIRPNLAVAMVGAGCIGMSYYISFSKHRKLKSAIDAYNW